MAKFLRSGGQPSSGTLLGSLPAQWVCSSLGLTSATSKLILLTTSMCKGPRTWERSMISGPRYVAITHEGEPYVPGG